MLTLSADPGVEAGFAADEAAVGAYADEVRAFAGGDVPARQSLAWRHGPGDDLLDAGQRRREIGNFLAHLSSCRSDFGGQRDRVAR